MAPLITTAKLPGAAAARADVSIGVIEGMLTMLIPGLEIGSNSHEQSVGQVLGQGMVLGGVFSRAAGGSELARAAQSAKAPSDLAELSGMLREAARGKDNFGVGSATSEQAGAMGRAWVGEGAKLASDGRTMVSQDGLRQYRPPSTKPRLGRIQANLEGRNAPKGEWQSNAHVDIKK